MTTLAQHPAATESRRPMAPWLIAAAAMLCCGWGGNQFTPLLAMYRSLDGFSEVTVDALLAAYVVGLVPALLIGGGLSDTYGRKRLMSVALAACTLGSLSLCTAALPGLALGRLLSGVGIGLAMAVGSTWVVELTTAGGQPPARGARRGALWLTAGLGGGAGVAGVLAQWAPLPQQLPYLVQASAALTVLALTVTSGEETVTGGPVAGTAQDGSRSLLPEVIANPRFRRLILPMAPWIFGAAGVAYATVPQALSGRVGHWELLYATVLTVCTLGSGFAIHPLAHKLDHHIRPRAVAVGMVSMTVGIALAATAVGIQKPWFGILSGVVLGCAYGIAVVSGLLELQRIAKPHELARATGIFYALAYIGFLFPMLIAICDNWVSTSSTLWVLTGVAACCALTVSRGLIRRRA